MIYLDDDQFTTVSGASTDADDSPPGVHDAKARLLLHAGAEKSASPDASHAVFTREPSKLSRTTTSAVDDDQLSTASGTSMGSDDSLPGPEAWMRRASMERARALGALGGFTMEPSKLSRTTTRAEGGEGGAVSGGAGDAETEVTSDRREEGSGAGVKKEEEEEEEEEPRGPEGRSDGDWYRFAKSPSRKKRHSSSATASSQSDSVDTDGEVFQTFDDDVVDSDGDFMSAQGTPPKAPSSPRASDRLSPLGPSPRASDRMSSPSPSPSPPGNPTLASIPTAAAQTENAQKSATAPPAETTALTLANAMSTLPLEAPSRRSLLSSFPGTHTSERVSDAAIAVEKARVKLSNALLILANSLAVKNWLVTDGGGVHVEANGTARDAAGVLATLDSIREACDEARVSVAVALRQRGDGSERGDEPAPARCALDTTGAHDGASPAAAVTAVTVAEKTSEGAEEAREELEVAEATTGQESPPRSPARAGTRQPQSPPHSPPPAQSTLGIPSSLSPVRTAGCTTPPRHGTNVPSGSPGRSSTARQLLEEEVFAEWSESTQSAANLLVNEEPLPTTETWPCSPKLRSPETPSEQREGMEADTGAAVMARDGETSEIEDAAGNMSEHQGDEQQDQQAGTVEVVDRDLMEWARSGGTTSLIPSPGTVLPSQSPAQPAQAVPLDGTENTNHEMDSSNDGGNEQMSDNSEEVDKGAKAHEDAKAALLSPVMRPLPACVGRSLARSEEEWEELTLIADNMVVTRLLTAALIGFEAEVVEGRERRRIERERRVAARIAAREAARLQLLRTHFSMWTVYCKELDRQRRERYRSVSSEARTSIGLRLARSPGRHSPSPGTGAGRRRSAVALGVSPSAAAATHSSPVKEMLWMAMGGGAEHYAGNGRVDTDGSGGGRFDTTPPSLEQWRRQRQAASPYSSTMEAWRHPQRHMPQGRRHGNDGLHLDVGERSPGSDRGARAPASPHLQGYYAGSPSTRDSPGKASYAMPPSFTSTNSVRGFNGLTEQIYGGQSNRYGNRDGRRHIEYDVNGHLAYGNGSNGYH